MSDPQANPALELDENGIDPSDVDPSGQAGAQDGGAGDPADAGVTAEQAEEEERQRLSRFQRLKQTHETQMTKKEQELEYWRNLAISEGKVQVQQKPLETDDAAPVLADFEGQGIDAYVAAHGEWVRKKVMAEAVQTARQQAATDKIRAQLETRVQAAKTKLPDWEEVLASSEHDALPDTQDFLVESEIGPEIGYYLAKFPGEHERINKLSSIRRVAELGKIEDKLSAKSAAAPANPAQGTKAPQKLSKVNGAAAPSTDRAAAARQGYSAWKQAKDAAAKK